MSSATTAIRTPTRRPSARESTIGFGIGFLVCLALIPLQIEDLFGLPAHPLLLHIPVVLIPVLALATVTLMIRSEWRRRLGLALAVLALLALLGTVVTVGAGHGQMSGAGGGSIQSAPGSEQGAGASEGSQGGGAGTPQLFGPEGER